jgi:hypothetical protein
MNLDTIVQQWLDGTLTSAEAFSAIQDEGLFAEAFMIALTHMKSDRDAAILSRDACGG